MEKENADISDKFDWMKKHVDTVIVIGGILSCVFWMNGKFNDIDQRFNNINERFTDRFNSLEKEILTIQAVLIMKNIMPIEMAHEAVK